MEIMLIKDGFYLYRAGCGTHFDVQGFSWGDDVQKARKLTAKVSHAERIAKVTGANVAMVEKRKLVGYIVDGVPTVKLFTVRVEKDGKEYWIRNLMRGETGVTYSSKANAMKFAKKEEAEETAGRYGGTVEEWEYREEWREPLKAALEKQEKNVEPEMMTARQIAAMMNVSDAILHVWARKGYIKRRLRDGNYYFDMDSVVKYLEGRRKEKKPERPDGQNIKKVRLEGEGSDELLDADSIAMIAGVTKTNVYKWFMKGWLTRDACGRCMVTEKELYKFMRETGRAADE